MLNPWRRKLLTFISLILFLLVGAFPVLAIATHKGIRSQDFLAMAMLALVGCLGWCKAAKTNKGTGFPK